MDEIAQQVERIKALDSKRTQGDWHISAVHVCAGHLGIVEAAHEDDVSTDQLSADLFFIAAAPEMAALISTLHDKLVAAEKDAERYRMVRRRLGIYAVAVMNQLPEAHGKRFDEAADNAIAAATRIKESNRE